MSDLICQCGKQASPTCVDGHCGACCENENCERHKKGIVIPSELFFQLMNCCDMQYNNLFNNLNDSDSESEFACDVCGSSNNRLFNCNGCDKLYCVYCKQCYEDEQNQDNYCEDCYMPPEDPKCVACGKQSDMKCWGCESCDEVYCFDCLGPNILFDECPNEDCYYCRQARCWNNRMYELCNRCFNLSLIHI